jgi:hypothetical protein
MAIKVPTADGLYTASLSPRPRSEPACPPGRFLDTAFCGSILFIITLTTPDQRDMCGRLAADRPVTYHDQLTRRSIVGTRPRLHTRRASRTTSRCDSIRIKAAGRSEALDPTFVLEMQIQVWRRAEDVEDAKG